MSARLGTAHAFRTIWRVFFRFVSDDAILKRAPIVYAKSRNVGRLEVASLEDGQTRLLLHDWPDARDRDLRVIGVALHATLEVIGRRDVRLQWTRTASGARYDLTWRRKADPVR